MKIFLTGATGVIGRRTVPLLLAAGHDVTAVARGDAKAAELAEAGATPLAVDLLDPDAVGDAVVGHETVIHLATNIPTGASAASRRGWRTNDRLRTEAALNLREAAVAAGATRLVQESITFPYVDGGNEWIGEDHPREYFWGNASTRAAEDSCADFGRGGGTGVVLRFAMFFAPDSAHVQTFVGAARKGMWGIFGADAAPISFVHVDDAAAAVVGALDAPTGVYNVAEPEPTDRAAHRRALADVVGRSRLRALAPAAQRALGPAAASLSRAHRISSTALSRATDWTPHRRVVDHWKDCA